jgi:DNA-binding beta-propeller fold protein YncE
VVCVVDTRRASVTHRIRIGGRPSHLAASPDGERVYVAGHTGGAAVIRTADKRIRELPGLDRPTDVIATPDGRAVYFALLS